MANRGEYTHYYDDIPKIARIIIQIIFGAIIGNAYRILRFFETKNVVTLIVGIVGFIPPVIVVVWVVDLITTITKGGITVLAD